ncbi:helix-turn-helix transcriptional regulator [Saccharothrix algeriensis]|uniref:DNA-binding transcriptional regulator YafY n=1 Tax=Saccharothrix algeriensis TaxID=173560 RepID=A0A8T8HX11_9PSEU|nr:WYL domain-containing protein [Saccharothrix algeriensis]MBM7813904.1 putative DNA-binding transcriptional regulator YafY [Saccharothrix algeriensis]QTR02334.1 WYL domain-containing protein [Saccharothrix algeriensis]
MRAGRLLSLLLLLQSRGRLTAHELARELEVSVRTIYRDVEALGAAGVPVYADRGPAGGYRLLDGYRTRLTGLTGPEADSLLFAGMPGPAADLGLGAVVAAAQLKLLAALPPELRSRAGRIRERFHLDTSGWFRQPEEMPFLSTVADAVWEQRRLRVRYRRWGSRGGEVERVLGPVGLVLKAGLWYLVAEADGEPRTYRVSRVLEAHRTDEPFERPAGFDLAAFWADWSARFEERMYPMAVTVRLSPAGLERARALLGQVASRALAEVEPEEGWTTARVPVESLEHALGDLLRLGPGVEVVEPVELRDRIRAALREMAAVYADRP